MVMTRMNSTLYPHASYKELLEILTYIKDRKFYVFLPSIESNGLKVVHTTKKIQRLKFLFYSTLFFFFPDYGCFMRLLT